MGEEYGNLNSLMLWESVLKKHLPLILIVLASMIALMASDIFLPSMPEIEQYFSVNSSKIQLSIPFYLGGQIIATLFWGVLSDNFGRKKVFSLGMCVFFIGTLICISSTTIYTFLLGRIIQGMGAIVAPVVGWAFIQDLYPKDKSAIIISWVGSIITLAPMVAPAIGGQITKYYHWKGDFYFIAFFTSLILIGLSTLPEIRPTTKRVHSTKQAIEQYTHILRNKRFVSYVSLFALLACGQWCFLTIAPFLYKNTMQLSVDKIGFYMGLSTSFFVIGASIAAPLMTRLGVDGLLNIGTKLSILSGFTLLGLHIFDIYNPLIISQAFGFYLFSASFIWGASSSRALQCYEEARGAASSIRSLLMISFFSAGSYLGTLIRNDSLFDVSIILVLVTLSSFLLYFVMASGNQSMDLTKESSPA
jgi:Bcr/CflA subfamily drug resistance transporter